MKWPRSVALFFPLTALPPPFALVLGQVSPPLTSLLALQQSSSSRFSVASLLSGGEMSERRISQDDDTASLLSKLGSDSPRPRMKYGGMFCSVEGAFENKTLNFESFSPQTPRRRTARAAEDPPKGGFAAFPSGRVQVRVT